jgi:hypothetical protein
MGMIDADGAGGRLFPAVRAVSSGEIVMTAHRDGAAVASTSASQTLEERL